MGPLRGAHCRQAGGGVYNSCQSEKEGGGAVEAE